MTVPSVEDVIARALVDDLCIRCIGRRHRLAAAVVAAIRAMTVEQQAELIGGEVERADLKRLAADGRFAWVPCSRVVTEWRAEP